MGLFDLFGNTITEKKLVGVWKHRILASWVSINDGPVHNNYHYEIFNFRSDNTFSFGEYGSSKPLFEVSGKWRLSSDRKNILLSYTTGESSSIDIRDFKGNSFITTSSQGKDFLFIKE